MTPPSYVGKTCVGRCPNCGHLGEVVHPDLIPPFSPEGECTSCETLVEWERWTGPVTLA